MKGSKIISAIVAMTMILSAVVVLETVTEFKFVEKASATTATLLKDGSGGAWDRLYCGEEITFMVSDNSLNASKTYYMKVWNGTAWNSLYIQGSKKSDEYGNIQLSVHVPSSYELGFNPLTGRSESGLSKGQYNISLFDQYGTQIAGTNKTITIGNLYNVRYYYNGAYINYLLYNKSYSDGDFYIYIANWTGTGWDTAVDDESFTVTVYEPDGTQIQTEPNVRTGYWDPDIARTKNNYGSGSGCLENYLWVNVTNNDYGNQYSNATLPTKLNMTITAPSSAYWSDTISVTGYLRDGSGALVTDYGVALYSPVYGTYYNTDSTEVTSSTGRYSFSIPTGSGTNKDDSASAGTWYIGTYRTGTYRIDETSILNIPNFIYYGSFEVSTKSATVNVVNSDDIISGFDQTINVTVKNMSYMNENEYRNMNIHVTGLKGWYGGVEYAKTDIVPVATSANITKYNDNYAWYEFEWRFNDTGTGTIWASWDGNLTSIKKTSTLAGESGTYSVKYSNEDLQANITGSKTFSIVSPDSMNLVISGSMVDAVQVSNLGSNKYQNSSATFTLLVYGATQDTPKNASINITGCGLNIRINESDAVADNEYLTAKGDGQYTISINPKYAGTLTIEATNGTDSVTKDYTINGLTGSVTTSSGDDLEVSVLNPESITVTVTNTLRGEVYLTRFDENWAGSQSINYTTGDATSGNGEGGIYQFTPDDDAFDTIGYIVVVAHDGGYYMYDIIEIAPIHDLTVEATNLDANNDTLTAGIEQDISLQITDPNGDVVSDIDSVIGKLYDENDVLQQTVTFTENGEYWTVEDQLLWFAGELRITAKNQTGEAEHDGTLTLDVDLATITYTPDMLTAGIGTTNVTIAVLGVDANGNPLPSGTTCYRNINGTGTTTDVASFTLDADGEGEFVVETVGDVKGHINITLGEGAYVARAGNYTNGQITIIYPVFTITPSIIYLSKSNIVTIIAKDGDGEVIEGINITLFGNTITQPDPVQTDANGKVILQVEPTASGIANVTIARNLTWVNGVLDWDNAVVTDSYVTIDSLQDFTITVSKSPVYQGETLTVTVTSGGVAVSGVDVTFGQLTGKTDSTGEVDFTAPDPGVESATYYITAEKDGYNTKDKSITVIKKYAISIVLPEKVCAGESFTITVIAKGGPLAGATVTLDGTTTKTSGGDGKVTFTAGEEGATHTIEATYDTYTKGTASKTVEKCTPGFELLTLIAAIGVAFILLRRRKQN